ncbi:MAG: helicase-associated domain-containing protein [Anaerolineae bacterium]|nr:helicase-associated domain-containing protein [Anaerolineae bacterium]
MNWNDVLHSYEDSILFNIYCNVANEKPGNKTFSREQLVDGLRKRLGKPEQVRTALTYIGRIEAFIIKQLIAQGGTQKIEDVRKSVKENGFALKVSSPNPSDITPDYQGVPTFEDLIARLAAVGLVFSRDTSKATKLVEWAHGRILYIPDPIRHVLMMTRDLRDNLDKLMHLDIVSVALGFSPKTIIHNGASEFQRDVSRYWRHVRRVGRLNITANGWIYKNTYKHVLAALNSPPDAPTDESGNLRLWFIRRLLTCVGDFKLQNSELLATEPPSLLQMSMAERIRHCFETWRDGKVWSEFIELMNGPLPEQESMLWIAPELNKARTTFLRVMARLSANNPQGWVAASDLVNALHRTEYEWLFPRTFRGKNLKKANSLYKSPYYYENNPYRITFENITSEEQGWLAVEGAAIFAILQHPLSWLGLIDMGYTGDVNSKNTREIGCRLTETGAWLLGIGPQPQFVESGGRVVVQPNFTILAMEPIPDSVILALDTFAEPKGGDRVLNYELNRASVYRAQTKGKSVAEIVQFLEQHQGGPLSNNVRRTLEEWDALHQRIVIYRDARLLQFANAKAKATTQPIIEQANDDGDTNIAKKAVFANLNENFMVSKHAEPNKQLVDRLSSQGWIPINSPAGSVDVTNSVRLEDSGDFEFRQPTPSIYALSVTDQWSTRTANGGKITPNSVRAAMSKGVKLDDLLSQLKNLSGGTLAFELETNIRSWAGFYGKASLKTVCLLELSNREVLDNLLKDRVLGKFLKPIEGSAKPMALVDEAHAEQVASVLRERGVVV